jgi:HD-like signal output (HDOD) protein
MMLVNGFLVRRSFAGGHCALLNFWELSSRRALAMSFLARKLHVCTPEQAHTFGLFSDLGIPMLLQRFDDYAQTLQLANESGEQSFTLVEEQRHHTNHAVIGALLARNWSLSADMVMAIRLHHDYSIFEQNQVPREVKQLIAMGILADGMIQVFQGQGVNQEQRRAQPLAMEELGVGDDELEDLGYAINKLFGGEG